MADLVRGVVRGATVRGDQGEVYGSPLCSASYSPVEGDSVMLLVQAGTAVVLGKVAVMGTAASGSPASTTDPVPPPTATSGTLSLGATDSGSWRSIDGWGSPSSGRGASLDSTLQGTYTGSNPYSGAFFYGTRAGQLAGATVTAVRLRFGSRLRIGSYNSSLTVHVYVHTNSSRPGGDVTRTLGPYDFTLVANAAGGWVGTLPGACYSALVAGGGISLYGSPYLGVAGIGTDPASGQLDFDWTR